MSTLNNLASPQGKQNQYPVRSNLGRTEPGSDENPGTLAQHPRGTGFTLSPRTKPLKDAIETRALGSPTQCLCWNLSDPRTGGNGRGKDARELATGDRKYSDLGFGTLIKTTLPMFSVGVTKDASGESDVFF